MERNGKTTGLFVCECGPNLSEGLDLKQIVRWARERPDVAVVTTHPLFCSPAGKAEFKKRLEAAGVTRAVVAGCTPKMHEKTFRDLALAAGLNLAHVQVANIREQCAWVTKDRDEATAKARRIIRAALRRVAHSEALEAPSMEVQTDLVVIGGGIAGIEAALTAAEAGRKVAIVERDISLGGSVMKIEEVAPSLDCAPCLIAPRLAAVRDHPDITVLTNAEVVEVLGFYGNFTVKVRTRPRYVEETCIGCEACFEVCPVTVKSEFHLGLGDRKAIHCLFPGSVPAAAAIDEDHCLHLKDGSCEACVPACPFSSIDFAQAPEEREIRAGAIVLATGLDDADLAAFPSLGHDPDADVYSLPEFERISCSNGPTGGKILRRNGAAPSSVVVVHCAGSLREDGVPWCSGTCCIDAIKAGRMVRGQWPETSVTHVHGDLVLPGPDGVRFKEAARGAGSAFVRCDDLRSVEVVKTGGALEVRGSGIDPIPADMVVLASGVAPSGDTGDLAELLDLELTPDGFFRAGHPVLSRAAATLDGVYLAGSVAGPCETAEAVTRARAAAGDAISRLVPGRRIELEAMTSTIDPERCAGCRLCLSTCPFRAITYLPDEEVCRVNEAICRGCGTCTAGCPSGASRAKHFSDEEICAEIRGIIDA